MFTNNSYQDIKKLIKFRYKIFRSAATRSPENRDKMDREDL